MADFRDGRVGEALDLVGTLIVRLIITRPALFLLPRSFETIRWILTEAFLRIVNNVDALVGEDD